MKKAQTSTEILVIIIIALFMAIAILSLLNKTTIVTKQDSSFSQRYFASLPVAVLDISIDTSVNITVENTIKEPITVSQFALDNYSLSFTPQEIEPGEVTVISVANPFLQTPTQIRINYTYAMMQSGITKTFDSDSLYFVIGT